MHLEWIEFAVIDAAKRIRHRQSAVDKIGSQSRPAIPVVDPAGLVPEPEFWNNIGCFHRGANPGTLAFTSASAPHRFGPVAAHFRWYAFAVRIDVTGGAVNVGDMPVGGCTIRCGCPVAACAGHRSMAINAFFHYGADVLAPHVIAAAGDLMARAGMAGGAGQFCAARGAEMDICGYRGIRHCGIDIAALAAVGAACRCMAFRYTGGVIGPMHGPCQRKRGLARGEVKTHLFMDLAVGFRQGYLVSTNRAVYA